MRCSGAGSSFPSRKPASRVAVTRLAHRFWQRRFCGHGVALTSDRPLKKPAPPPAIETDSARASTCPHPGADVLQACPRTTGHRSHREGCTRRRTPSRRSTCRRRYPRSPRSSRSSRSSQSSWPSLPSPCRRSSRERPGPGARRPVLQRRRGT